MQDNGIPKVIIHCDERLNGHEHIDSLNCWCMPVVLEMNLDENGFPVIGENGIATFTEKKRASN